MLISHAQNFEDVILWRALKGVHSGSYIDVGAQDPIVDSVSLAFYEKGWRGIHVEPQPGFADKLRNARPDERVIEAVVSDSRDKAHQFFSVSNTGLSTGIELLADHYRSRGLDVASTHVRSITLEDVFAEAGDREIHWLKIDAEGMEVAVLRSWGQSPCRPWIIVVEAICPTSLACAHLAWEPELTDRGYKFAYFDGVNRYYVSRQEMHLLEHFGPGPNALDEFRLSGNSTSSFCRDFIEKITAQDKANCELREELEAADTLVRLKTAEQDRLLIWALAAEAKTRNLERHLIAQLQKALDEAGAALDHKTSELDRLVAWARAAEIKITDLEDQLKGMIHAADVAAKCLEAIYRSTSWRITRPLRAIKRSAPDGRVALRRSNLMGHVVCFARRQSGLMQMIRRIFSGSPKIQTWAKRAAIAHRPRGASVGNGARCVECPFDAPLSLKARADFPGAMLPPRTARIYHALVLASQIGGRLIIAEDEPI